MPIPHRLLTLAAQAHSSSGEFPSITLSACDDAEDDEDDEDDLFGIQRDTVLDVGEVGHFVFLVVPRKVSQTSKFSTV